MKRIQYIISILLVGAFATGCIGNYEKINTNPYEATDEHVVADDYLIQGALKTMLGYYVPSQEHQFQFMNILCGSTLGGYLAEQKGWDLKTSTYNPNDEWAAFTFENVIPGVFGAYTQLVSSTEDPIARSVAEIVNVATFVELSDIYGPIPYSKIGMDGSLVAEYDSQQEIYDLGFEKLTAAINALTERSGSTLNANADMTFSSEVYTSGQVELDGSIAVSSITKTLGTGMMTPQEEKINYVATSGSQQLQEKLEQGMGRILAGGAKSASKNLSGGGRKNPPPLWFVADLDTSTDVVAGRGMKSHEDSSVALELAEAAAVAEAISTISITVARVSRGYETNQERRLYEVVETVASRSHDYRVVNSLYDSESSTAYVMVEMEVE